MLLLEIAIALASQAYVIGQAQDVYSIEFDVATLDLHVLQKI